MLASNLYSTAFNPTGMMDRVAMERISEPSVNHREVKSSPDSAPAIISEKKA